MKAIDIVNTVLVCLIFAGMSAAMVWSVASYNPSAVKAGIEMTVNGPGSNYIHKHDFGNTVKAR